MARTPAGRSAADAEDLARVTHPVPPTKPSALRRLDALRAAVPEAAEILLVGDSLAASWPDGDLAMLGLGSAFNFGLPGDRIQNTLWRLATVRTEHLRPSLCLVLLGTNNLGDGDPPGAIAAGVMRVAECAHAAWAPARLVVVGSPWRRPVGRVRERARRDVGARLRVACRDAGRLYLDPDPVLGAGRIRTGRTVAPDGLHLTPDAYRQLTVAVRVLLGEST